MAHFAKVNENGRVEAVIVIDNSVIEEPNLSFPETEKPGQDFIKDTLRLDGLWLQTSYSDSFRYNYATIGGEYREEADAFVPQRPFDSWELDETVFKWFAPVPYPEDGKDYTWDEPSLSWIASDEPS